MPQYRFGGCMFINNPQIVWDHAVAPNVMMIFIDETAKKLYKKYGSQFGEQAYIEEYDMTLVPSRQQQEASAMEKILNELTAMRARLDKIDNGGQPHESN